MNEPVMETVSFYVFEVTPTSSYNTRQRVQRCARLCSREVRVFPFGPPFHATHDEGYSAFLWLSPGRDTLGAVCFRWREYLDAASRWSMHWAWFEPSSRRAGLLTAALPLLGEKLGAFDIEGPLSNAMRAFCAKHALSERVVGDHLRDEEHP